MLKLINNQYNLLYKSMMEKKLKKPSSIKNVVEIKAVLREASSESLEQFIK